MKIREVYETAKSGLKVALIVYAMGGSMVMLPYTCAGEITGHRSSDIATGKVPLTKLEKKALDFIGIKYGGQK